jgi:E3 ubiquitin-protein ligase DOA10
MAYRASYVRAEWKLLPTVLGNTYTIQIDGKDVSFISPRSGKEQLSVSTTPELTSLDSALISVTTVCASLAILVIALAVYVAHRLELTAI